MPLVRIEVLKGRPPEERRAVLDAVHAALVEAFKIPDDDRTQRLIEHDQANFEIPPGASAKYTLIEITAFPGRSREAKKELFSALTVRLGGAGIPASDISIVLLEPPMDSWGVAGGKPADEVDLSYPLDV